MASTMEPRLNETDRAIIREIRDNGRATTTLVANVVDVSRPYVSDRITRMREHGFLTEVAPNLYDVTEKGRNTLDK
ncbi:winged helix-turn-helix transcriptional regulator [Halococcus morrhuae DSM 1307]|uniref:winged helix-turn-helix transcriptional regulator n=1 Tax=Halococcus morrhuae TaxID=2250 RepID=UPI0009B5A013